jgi:hypothetical protein
MVEPDAIALLRRAPQQTHRNAVGAVAFLRALLRIVYTIPAASGRGIITL